MAGSSPSKAFEIPPPSKQLREDFVFTDLILCDSENERYYDLAYESAKAQHLPFAEIKHVRLGANLLVHLASLLPRIKTEWLIYHHADVQLLESATARLRPFLVDSSVSGFRCGASNALLGEQFINEFGSPDVGVIRTSSLKAALDRRAPAAFDPLIPVSLTGSVILLRSRTRIGSNRPGAYGEELQEICRLGANVAEWSAWYAYYWCRLLGAQLRMYGGTNYRELAHSMLRADHPQWQIGLAGFINGILSGDGPKLRDELGRIRAEFAKAQFLAGKTT